MRLSALPMAELKRRLVAGGVGIQTGPFNFRIRSAIPSIAEGLHRLYADYTLLGDDEFVDFDVHMDRGSGLRRWVRPQVRFRYDGDSPFEPLPISHAYPLLEWAMNWCISTQAHQFLMLHAAVIERGGVAAILPAPPGSGKSTLCAGLISRGWRLLSDELTLISLQDRSIAPLCRPVSLKNQSLEIIGAYAPSAVFNDITHDTSKGTVGHMKAAQEHLNRSGESARPGWVVFPKYVAGAQARLTTRTRAGSLLELGRNAFNYALLGRVGFETLAGVVAQCECYDFEYSALDDAVEVFAALEQARRS
jgi:HprK-related kinase A